MKNDLNRIPFAAHAGKLWRVVWLSCLRAVPEIIPGGVGHFFCPDPSIPRMHMESEPPDPQDSSVNQTPHPQDT